MHLRDYLVVLRHHWVLIAACGALGLALASAYCVLVKPTYEATSKVFVSTSATSVQDLAQGNVYGQQVVASYADVATTPFVLQPVIDELGLKVTPQQLAESVSSTAPAGTVLVEITVGQHNAADAARIANAVSTSLTSQVGDLVPRAEGASAVKITRVQAATVPVAASNPNIPLDISLGLLLGLLLGLVLALLHAALDTRIRNKHDVQTVSDATILGHIFKNPALERGPILAGGGTLDPLAEGFRSLRTNLQFLQFEHQRKVIAVTSSVPGEGKSTLASNLAIVLADSGDRVLLIEGDLRRPRLATYLGLDGALGLTDLLIGKNQQSTVVQAWGSTTLDVLPSGSIPPNPSELLGSAAMREFVDRVSAEYDIVLIDSPPLLPVTDAAIVSRLSDGVLVLCAARRIRRQQLRAALDVLDTVQARVLGVVLTMVPFNASGTYGYGAYAGSYSYGTSNAG